MGGRETSPFLTAISPFQIPPAFPPDKASVIYKEWIILLHSTEALNLNVDQKAAEKQDAGA